MDKNTILSGMKEEIFSYGKLTESIKNAGVEQGDVICVHSDLLPFGMYKIPRHDYEQAFVDALLEAVGVDGTLVMPTFSYSFCKDEIYNVQETKSTVGSLTEYFRKLPNTVRTLDPIFSYAICGKNVDRYKDIGEDCFSRDSMYGKLLDDNAKILFLGAIKGLTFHHFLEETMHVPYRFLKRFEGTIVDGEKKYQTYRDYFVRHLDQNSNISHSGVIQFLRDEGIVKEVQIGKAVIACVKCRDWFEKAQPVIQKDPYHFVIKEFDV